MLEYMRQVSQIWNFISVYYSIQIGHCILISWVMLVLVLLLRKTVFRNRVYAKGSLWLLFLPVLLSGRLHFFYQTRTGVRLFYWWHSLCIDHVWISYICLGGIAVSGMISLIRYLRLQHYVRGLRTCMAAGHQIYVCKARVTPFSTGLMHCRIVIPEHILDSCSEEELTMIVLHEQTHGRLLHLWIYAVWNLMCVILWMNPLLSLAGKYLREDMELICDAHTIRACGDQAYTYGHVILKAYREMRVNPALSGSSGIGAFIDEDSGNEEETITEDGIREEEYIRRMTATFVGESGYDSVKQRILAIGNYRRMSKWRRILAGILIVVLALILTVGTKLLSYRRYTEIAEGGIVYSMRLFYKAYEAGIDQPFTNGMVLSDYTGDVIYLRDGQIHIDGGRLMEEFPEYALETEPMFVYCGGFYKLPGMGGGGGFGYLDKQEIHDGEIVIDYEDPNDYWEKLLKWI